MATKKVTRSRGTKKPAPKSSPTATDQRLLVSISRAEFESVCEQLKDLTHVTIEAWATQRDEADGLEHVLVKLHAARRNLESAVEPEVQQPEGGAP